MLLKAREIFAAGMWNGKPFTTTDLDVIVNSFNALGLAGRIPLKVGHDGHDARTDEEHQFAAGWVENVWRDEDRLMADLDVSEKIAPLIDSKALKFVSVELLKNVKADTRVIPWVLDAVALLGTEQPAVGVLKSLQGYKAERKPRQYADGARLSFARDAFKPNGVSNTMTDEEIKALQVQAAQAEKFQRELNDEKAARLKDKADANRAKIAERFKRAIDDGECLPKDQNSFDRSVINLTDAQWAGEDKRVDVLKDAEAHIKENPVPEHMKRSGKGGARSGTGATDESEIGKPAGDVLAFRVARKLEATNVQPSDIATFDRITKIELQNDPELARIYRDDPTTPYTKKSA